MYVATVHDVCIHVVQAQKKYIDLHVDLAHCGRAANSVHLSGVSSSKQAGRYPTSNPTSSTSMDPPVPCPTKRCPCCCLPVRLAPCPCFPFPAAAAAAASSSCYHHHHHELFRFATMPATQNEYD